MPRRVGGVTTGAGARGCRTANYGRHSRARSGAKLGRSTGLAAEPGSVRRAPHRSGGLWCASQLLIRPAAGHPAAATVPQMESPSTTSITKRWKRACTSSSWSDGAAPRGACWTRCEMSWWLRSAFARTKAHGWRALPRSGERAAVRAERGRGRGPPRRRYCRARPKLPECATNAAKAALPARRPSRRCDRGGKL